MTIQEMIEKTKTEIQILKELKKSADGYNKFYCYAVLMGKLEAAEMFLKTLEETQKEVQR